jgi:hypothetical protein
MKLRYSVLRYTIFLLLVLPNISFSQNLDDIYGDIKKVFKEKPFKFSGGISSNINYSFNNGGIEQRALPFRFQTTANLNISLFNKFNIPLNANFSNGGFLYDYKLPAYSFINLKPSYKWGTLHVGNSSMDFSKYTLSGHSFYGIGTELTPGKINVSAMYGRLKRAVEEDLGAVQNIEPAYKRMGTGVKLGYGSGSEKITLIFFKGWDDLNSVPTLSDSLSIKPFENTIVSLQGSKSFGKVVSVDFDYAHSAFTENSLSAELLQSDNTNVFKTLGGTFNPKASTLYANAIKTNLNFKLKTGSLGIGHERVGPNYRTLGALFFENDYENFTGNISSPFFKGKVNLTANAGVQRNDVRGIKTNSSFRFIGAANMNVTLSPDWNVNLNYSNFRNTNRQRAISVPFVQVDSIILTQVNQSANFSTSYTTGKDKNSTFSLMMGYQKSNSIEDDVVLRDKDNTNFVGNISHSYIVKDKKFALTSSFLVSQSSLNGSDILSISPTVSVNKPLFEEKVKSGLSLTYVSLSDSGTQINELITLRSSFSFKLFEQHSFSINVGGIYRGATNSINARPQFFETTGGLGYRWSIK